MLMPLFASYLLALTAREAPKAPPNIVLIISDDQAFTDYGFMGHPNIQTPNIDRMARKGKTFNRGYVTSSLCSPSLSALVTGRYPHETGLTSNEPPLPAGVDKAKRYQNPGFLAEVSRMQGLLARQPRLPALLRDSGYLTLETGKWWIADPKASGFTHGMTHGDPAKGGRHGDKGLEIGRTTMAPIRDFLTEAKTAQKPFFIWYAPMMPHQPHNPPERLLAKYRGKTPSLHVAKYWAMCEWFDETVGELLGMLEKNGQAENTLVAYVTDNGWIQDPTKAQYRVDSKQSQYDTGVRTPIILHQPGTIAAGVTNTPVNSLDLTATLIRAAGVPVPPALRGIDLLDAKAVTERGPVFGECYLHDAADLDQPKASLTYRFIVEGDWKLILPNPATVKEAKKPGRGTGPELYDLKSDPLEETNLFAGEKDLAAKLEKKLDSWWKP